jgi:8-oxo-dGTP diphosphatase
MNNAERIRGTGLIIHHLPSDEFLFAHRDNIPSIPFPDMYDIIGGHAEEGEQPLETLERELAKELSDVETGKPYQPEGIVPFKQYIDKRGVEQNLFALEIESGRPNLQTNEGQGLVWLSRDEIQKAEFAFDFKDVILGYIRKSGGRER